MKKLIFCTISLLLASTSLIWGQIELLGTNFSKATPRNNQEAFSKYFTGGFLTSGSYYQFMNPGKGISHIEGASITGLHYSWHKFGIQQKPAPLPVITVGLLDNVAAIQGEINGDLKSSYLVDLGSLGAGYTLPMFNYGAFLNVGAKLTGTYNSTFADSVTAYNVVLVNVRDFTESEDISKRKAELNDSYFGVNAEAAAKLGVRVYTNWYVTLSFGLRLSPKREGKWYLKSDVDQWLNDPGITYSPEFNYYVYDNVPDNNFLIKGTSLFLHLGISPFF